MQVTSSECSRDEAGMVDEKHLDSEGECRQLCDTYSDTVLGCSFSAWSPYSSGNCRLYRESFWQYLGHCDLLAGPAHLSGCNVEEPEYNSCQAVREGDCTFDGKLLKSLDNLDQWESCEAACSISSECQAWNFRLEPSLECRLLDSDAKTCITTYTTSHVDPTKCDCGDGWSVFNNTCYRILNNNNQQYDNIGACRLDCAALGGVLGSIHSQPENDFIYQMLRPASDDEVGAQATWLGVSTPPANGTDYSWEDGSPWDYSKWAPGEPDGYKWVFMGYYHSTADMWNDNNGGHDRIFDCLCKRSL